MPALEHDVLPQRCANLQASSKNSLSVWNEKLSKKTRAKNNEKHTVSYCIYMQDSTAVARVVSPGYHFAGDKVLPGLAQVFMGLSQNGGCVYTLHIGILVW